MTGKGKNPKAEKDSAKPDSAPEKSKGSAEAPEVIPPKESIPPALATSLKPKQEKKSSGLWGVVVLFLLIIAGGIGAGGYYLYQEQMKLQNQNLAKFAQLESQLNALDTEADQARQNKQSLDALNQELQQFKTEMDTTLKSHQNSLSTLDEDVMRLKEKVISPVEAPVASHLSPMIKAPSLNRCRESFFREVRMTRPCLWKTPRLKKTIPNTSLKSLLNGWKTSSAPSGTGSPACSAKPLQ